MNIFSLYEKKIIFIVLFFFCSDSTGQVRDIWVRYVRDYPVENNDWGDFQTHRYVFYDLMIESLRLLDLGNTFYLLVPKHI